MRSFHDRSTFTGLKLLIEFQCRLKNSEKTTKSYVQAAHAPNTQAGYKAPLKNTLTCPLQLRASMLDVLLAIEDQKLDEDLEVVQLIRGNTVLEIVMKTEKEKNRLLKGGLNIKGLHHRFKNSTLNRMPSRRTPAKKGSERIGRKSD